MSNHKKPKGWVKEPVRHGLAAKGIKTAPKAKRLMKKGNIYLVMNEDNFWMNLSARVENMVSKDPTAYTSFTDFPDPEDGMYHSQRQIREMAEEYYLHLLDAPAFKDLPKLVKSIRTAINEPLGQDWEQKNYRPDGATDTEQIEFTLRSRGQGLGLSDKGGYRRGDLELVLASLADEGWAYEVSPHRWRWTGPLF